MLLRLALMAPPTPSTPTSKPGYEPIPGSHIPLKWVGVGMVILFALAIINLLRKDASR